MRDYKGSAEIFLGQTAFPGWSGRAGWSVGDRSVQSAGGEVDLYGGTPRNV